MKIKFFILRCSVSLLLSVGILAPAGDGEQGTLLEQGTGHWVRTLGAL